MAKKQKKLPILATAGVLAFGAGVYDGYRGAGGSKAGMPGVQWKTIGIDNAGKFQGKQFVKNVFPLVVGIGGSMMASKLDLNRHISFIPFVKL